MNTALSLDEFIHILLFLPACDVSHFSQTNSTTYDNVISNQYLWTALFERDFPFVMQLGSQQGSSLLTAADATMMVGTHYCGEMKMYAWYYLRFYQFPFDRVNSKSMDIDTYNHTKPKILFGACNNRLNQSVVDTLTNRQFVIQQDGVPYKEPMGVDLWVLRMASRYPKETPNLTFHFWMIGQHLRLRFASVYYRATPCLVITVDTNDAWSEDSYSGSPLHGTNSLSIALTALTESKSLLNFEPPRACKGVLIVGIGVWSEAAPISKQRFLKDCAQSFDALPLEYYELTCNNATVMSDVLLKRLYTFHQAALEDVGDVTSVVPTSRCILS